MDHTLVTGGSGLLGRAIMRSDYGSVTGSKLVGTTRRNDSKSGLLTLHYRPEEASEIIERFGKIREVIHCAGVPAVFASLRDPVMDHANNVSPYLWSLELARATGAKITLLSSMEVYGDLPPEQRTEDAGSAPENFYGLSKLHCEALTRMYHQQFGIDYLILRPAIHIGIGFNKGLLHDLLTGFANRRAVVDIYCTLDSILSFAPVDEVCSAMSHLYRENLENDTWNVSLGEAYRVSEIIEWFSKRFDHNPEIRIREENHQVKTAPTDKMLSTGWRPSMGFWEWLERITDTECGNLEPNS